MALTEWIDQRSQGAYRLMPKPGQYVFDAEVKAILVSFSDWGFLALCGPPATSGLTSPPGKDNQPKGIFHGSGSVAVGGRRAVGGS